MHELSLGKVFTMGKYTGRKERMNFFEFLS